MKRPTTLARLGAVALISALALAGCGSDDDGGSDNNDSGNTAAKGDGTLTIGTLLPSTGDLAYLGPPEFAGVDLAINEINDAGGVNGKPIKQIKSDSGDGTPDIAGASVDKLINGGTDVVVGAASSSVSLSVIDKITGGGMVHFSPANTAAAFDTYDDGDLYFRTSPSDRLQGQVIGNLAVEEGFKNVAVLARQDAYGEGLAQQVVDTLKEKGAGVASHVLYNADAENYTAEVNEVAASKPDAIVLVAFEETTKIVPALVSKGFGPDKVQYYFVDGNMADYSDTLKQVDLTGVKGTFPAPADPDPTFNDKLLEIDPDLKDFTYGPQSYDAVMLTALAAQAAGDDDGKAIAAKLIEVSSEGTECSGWEECSGLLEDGEDIDYNGVSGPCDFNDTGSPNKATIGIQEYTGNKYKQVDSVSGVLD